MGAALAMLARGCAHKECLSGSRGPADVKRSPRASPGLPASLSSRGETPSASAMLITRVGSGTNYPRLGLASPCPQHFASALAFSGDQTLSSLSLASFDASLHGCKAVLVGRCSNAQRSFQSLLPKKGRIWREAAQRLPTSSPPFVCVRVISFWPLSSCIWKQEPYFDSWQCL